MKLNIVTGSSNSLGKCFLRAMAKKEDITIGFSRRGCELENVINIKVDLLDKNSIKKELFGVLTSLDVNSLSSIHLVHTASKIKNEFIDINLPEYSTIDYDGDWVDDEVYHCTFTTFKNTHEALIECLSTIWKQDLPKYLNIIWSLVDKKNWEPSSHKSMVRANKILRNYVQQVCNIDKSHMGNCCSVGTLATESELKSRPYWEHQYWLKEEVVVHSILDRNVAFIPWKYDDENRYEPNPQYETYYKEETDEQMSERFKREIGLI